MKIVKSIEELAKALAGDTHPPVDARVWHDGVYLKEALERQGMTPGGPLGKDCGLVDCSPEAVPGYTGFRLLPCGAAMLGYTVRGPGEVPACAAAVMHDGRWAIGVPEDGNTYNKAAMRPFGADAGGEYEQLLAGIAAGRFGSPGPGDLDSLPLADEDEGRSGVARAGRAIAALLKPDVGRMLAWLDKEVAPACVEAPATAAVAEFLARPAVARTEGGRLLAEAFAAGSYSEVTNALYLDGPAVLAGEFFRKLRRRAPRARTDRDVLREYFRKPTFRGCPCQVIMGDAVLAGSMMTAADDCGGEADLGSCVQRMMADAFGALPAEQRAGVIKDGEEKLVVLRKQLDNLIEIDKQQKEQEAS